MLTMPLFVLGFLVLLLCIAGLLEYQFHLKSLSNIPLRIHVNGTRGKSSVTRLVAAGLREGGLKTFAKTTGTAPRVIDSDGKDRIIHRLRLPSIGEQVKLLNYFSKQKPDAVVIECMAVQPQYQWIAEHQMVKSHIGVITNVRPDHLDEMGPTEEDVARSLCNTVPVNSLLITGEDQKPEILKEVAEQNDTNFIKSDELAVQKSDLDGFSYIEHPSNIAVALDVCEKAGVNRKTAIKGMHKVQPDSGALISWELEISNKRIRFINGMAANDPVSTLQIWDFTSARFVKNKEATCVFFNSREDRPSRTAQMIELTFEKIKPNYFFIRGDKIDNVLNKFSKNSPNISIQKIGLSNSLDDVISNFKILPHNCFVYAIGNQVGAGQEILEKISRFKYNG